MPYRDWAYKITNRNLVERVERGFETEADAEEGALEIMRQKGNENNMRYVVYQAPYDDNEDEDEEEVFT